MDVGSRSSPSVSDVMDDVALLDAVVVRLDKEFPHLEDVFERALAELYNVRVPEMPISREIFCHYNSMMASRMIARASDLLGTPWCRRNCSIRF